MSDNSNEQEDDSLKSFLTNYVHVKRKTLKS